MIQSTITRRRRVTDYLRRHGSTREDVLLRELDLADGKRFLQKMADDELIERAGDKWKMPWSKG